MWADRLYVATRDPGALWRIAFWALTHAFLLACLVQLAATVWHPPYQQFYKALDRGDQQRAPYLGATVLAEGTFPEALDVVVRMAAIAKVSLDDRQPAEVNSRFIETACQGRPGRESDLIVAAWHSAHSKSGIGGTALTILATDRDAPPGAAYATGFIAVRLFDLDRAESWFAAESTEPYATWARRAEVQLAIDRGRPRRVEALLDKVEYYQAVPPGLRLMQDVRRGDWLRAAGNAVQTGWEGRSWQAWLMSLLAAVVWSLLAMRLANISWKHPADLAWGAFAFLAGGGAAVATLVVVAWQEQAFGFQRDGTFLGDFVYVFAGVAVREELLKLTMAAPLVVALVRWRVDNRILLFVGGMVGLGFAAAENLSYVDAGTAGTGFARFLSANFLHLATTAMVAEGLGIWLRHPRFGWDHFLFRFGGVILIHGSYNFFLMHAPMGEYAILSLIVLGVLAGWYFHHVRMVRLPEREIIALPAFFVMGLLGLLGAGYVLCSWDYGLVGAFRIMLQTFLSSGLLLFLFVREFEQVG